MKILTIDPGSKLGFCVADQHGWIEYGLKTIACNKTATLHERSEELACAIEDLFEEFEPDVLVIEDVPKGSHGVPSWQGRYWLITAYSKAVETAIRYGCNIVDVHPMTLRKFMGHARGSTKHQTISFVNEKLDLDLKISKHNQADALALWLYYLEQHKKAVA